MATRLKETYFKEVVAGMTKFGYKNVMEVPKVDKIVINMGVGDVFKIPKVLDTAVEDLQIILVKNL